MKKFLSALTVLVALVVMFSSCSKGDDPAPKPTAPLTIVKATPVNDYKLCEKNQIYTFEFSEKIVFDNANFKNYIEYIESYQTKEFTWTASYDGNKTVTIKTTNNIYFVFNNEFFWHFKKGAIKTPDGRVLADDNSKDGVYFHYFTKK